MAFTIYSQELGVSKATGSHEMQGFLQKTSRTFALTIPMLPESLRTEIGVAYLLFRIIDTFEDATNWEPSKRVDALKNFVRLLDEADDDHAARIAAGWVQDPPVVQPAYLELLGAAPRVVEWHRGLAPGARSQIRQHLERSALGMCQFVLRTDGQGVLRLKTMQDLRDYCFAVAGIVGQLLTELFLMGGQGRLAEAAGELRGRSVQFGEALQIVNILKDAGGDAAEGRVYLPRDVLLAEVFLLARADLRAAIEYTELLRAFGAPPGLVAFNAVNARLAIAALRLMRDRGLGSKLGRSDVLGIAADVMHAIEAGTPLFAPADLNHS